MTCCTKDNCFMNIPGKLSKYLYCFSKQPEKGKKYIYK